MGRKELRKRLNKEPKETISHDKLDQHHEDTNLHKTGIIILVIMVLVFGVTYGITRALMNDPKEDVVEDKDVERNYSYILAQDFFDRPTSNYVVFFVNGEEGMSQLDDYHDAFVSGQILPAYYIVNMAEQVNSSYLVDDTEIKELQGDSGVPEYNKKPTGPKNLEIYNFPTVVHVNGGKVEGYYENDEFYEEFEIEKTE